MFLTHGLNAHDELIPVEAVSSGRVSLTCPYCGQGLIARKGWILAWHFAHEGETCRDVAQNNDRITVPFYDRFDLGLSKRTFEALTAVHDNTSFSMAAAKTLEALGFAEWNQFAQNGRGDWTITHAGRIPFGETTLSAFADVQRETIAQKHAQLLDSVDLAARYDHLDHDTAVTDLRLYRAQLARLLMISLYLMEITGDGRKLYKIGLTSRSVDERAVEVQAALRPFLGKVKVKLLRVLAGRDLVERYALHRWREHQTTMGKMTEFFELDDRRRLLSEFTRLGDLDPTELEDGIITLAGKLPAALTTAVASYRSSRE
jgi:hypothetical protein